MGDLTATSEQKAVLKPFYRALTREAHVLTRDPDLLWQQMYNRLQWEEEVKQVIAPELARRIAPGTKPWLRVDTPFHESKALLHTLEGHKDWVDACAISPDGRLIASGSWDNTLRLWSVGTGQKLHVLEGHSNHVLSCAFSPDGRFIRHTTLVTDLANSLYRKMIAITSRALTKPPNGLASRSTPVEGTGAEPGPIISS